MSGIVDSVNRKTNVSRRSTAAFAGLAVAVAVASASILFARVPDTKFNNDESGWVASSYHYAGLLARGDFAWEAWLAPHLGAWGYLNPHLGKWLIGLPLLAAAPAGAERFDRVYEFSRSYDENVAAGNVPPRGDLLRARRVAATFGVLCALAVFATCWLLGNGWIAALAVALLLSNDLFLDVATQATTDTIYNFFLLCLGLVALGLMGSQKRAGLLRLGLGLGCVAGLACSVKVAGIVVASRSWRCCWAPSGWCGACDPAIWPWWWSSLRPGR